MSSLIDRNIIKLLNFLASTWFFVFSVLLLAFQSIWLAFTAIYPLPFDEYMHVGIAKIFSGQWSPFINTQPIEASLYGDITRDPSYIYHYLLSFPYRVLDQIFENPVSIIISLRLLNIALVCFGLILFRKLLIMWGQSEKISHSVIFIFVCIPIVPLVATHSNYDNLIFMLTPILLIVGTMIVKKTVSLATGFIWFITIGLFACLVKQAFMPIFIISLLGVLLHVYQRFGLSFLKRVAVSFRKDIKQPIMIFGLIMFVLIGGLSIERNGINYARYNTINPNCSQVQNISICENFMPWYRNQQNKLNKTADKEFGNPVSYTQHWASKIMRGYFAIFSHTPTQVVSSREPFGPISLKGLLPLPIVTASLLSCVAVIAMVSQFNKIWMDKHLRFTLVLCLSYIATLWIFNYKTYLSLGRAQAIQARYTYPILILILLLLAKSMSYLIKNNKIRTGLFTVVFFGLVWGGGIAGYLIRAEDTWYWQNETVILVNKRAQDILRHIVIH